MSALPRLPFGNHLSLDSAEDLGATLAAHDRARRIHLPDAPRDFRGHMSMLRVGDLQFSAFAHTPVTVEAGDAPGHAVMIPCFGSLTFTMKKRVFTAHSGHHLALLAGEGNIVETTLDSHVVAAIDKARLLATARSMLGLEDHEAVQVDLDQAREVSLQPAGLRMEEALGGMFRILDQLPSANLALLGLDDLFYRSLAAILSPQVAEALVNPPGKPRPAPARREIQAVCDHVQAHLTEPIGLSELEHISGLSARGLQLAFQKQFQCTPMQWVRKERLCLARRRLLTAPPDTKVTGIALDCGFTQLGAFASSYRALFGESPSETLRRRR